MSMPEAPVYENGSAIFGQDDVGAAGEILSVYAVTEAETPKTVAKDPFRLRRSRAYRGHIAMALVWRVCIWHICKFTSFHLYYYKKFIKFALYAIPF